MNERIKLLADQAMNYATDRLSQTHGSGPDFVNDFREKFAELIVRECMKVAVYKNSGYVHPADVAGYMAAGRSTAASLIKEHFGVEE